MSSYSLKPLTETSWILSSDGVQLALIISKNNELVALGSKLERSKFKDISDLSKCLGSKVTVEKTEDDSVEEVGNINGYPVKHTTAVALEDQELPVYKRSASSNTLYSAGYYGVKFPNGWVQSYCPKITTLQENEFIGPFTSKLEMQNAISQKKKVIEL